MVAGVSLYLCEDSMVRHEVCTQIIGIKKASYLVITTNPGGWL